MATRTTGVGAGGAEDGGGRTPVEGGGEHASPGVSRGEAADGNTQQIPLVEKPAELQRAKLTAEESPYEGDGLDGDRTLILQETKPMPSVAWPPPVPQVHEPPTRPPSLRRNREATQPHQTTAPHARPGLLTQELRRALPAWALPLLTFQPLSVWLGSRLGMTLLALLATMMIPAIAPRGTANWYGAPGGPPLNPVVDSIAGVWTRWDGQWYLKIATEGYRLDDGSSAFFPLYPWTVTVMGWLAGERFIWAGIFLSSAFFLGALVLLHRLVRFDFHEQDASRTVFYIAAFPMAFFFWAIYSESLFLLLSVGALLAMRAQRWWMAGACIALAVWTRTTGLLLLLPMAWELWRAYNPPLPTTPNAMPPRRPPAYAPLSLALPFASILLFALWSWVVFQDPLAPLNAQSGWNRQFSWPWQTIAGAWNAATQAGVTFQPESQAWTYLGALVLALAVGALSVRWLRPSYSIYLWAGILFPLFSATRLNPLLSYPRFVAVLFPAFIVLSLIGRNRYANQIITWVSLLLLGLYTIRFVNWYWVA
jgi:hypothetical protein